MLAGGLRDTIGDILPVYGRFRAHAGPDLPFIALAIIAILGMAATNTAMIWLIGVPFDQLQKGDYGAVYKALILFAAVVLLNQAFHFAEGMLSRWVGLRFIGRLRSEFFSHYMRLSFPGVAGYARGDQLSRLSGDVDRTRNLVLEVPFYLASHLFIFVFYTAMLFWIDWMLAGLAMAITPAFVLHQRYFGPRKRGAAERYLEKNAELVSLEEEALGNLRGISSFSAEGLIARRHGSVLRDALRLAFREDGVDVMFRSSLSMLIYLTGLAITLAGVYGMAHGRIGVGQLVSFLLYLGYLSVPVRGLAELAHESRGHAAAARRVMEIMDAVSEVPDSPGAAPLEIKSGRIDFKNVSFSYRGGGRVFSAVDLAIDGGETIALAGASGSGKSTLVKLLLRFYDPQEGAISIDGTDLRVVTAASLREKVAVVWQEQFLLNDTIRANLLIARPDAGEAELMEACAASNSWEFIGRLEKGLDTRIGAGGVELSTGQRQRISIAQAILRNAPILVLDEASSALDSHNERLITMALERLCEGRTTIIIAHRVSSIRSADRVVYFNGDGAITVGRHDELMAAHPGYSSAVHWQSYPGA